MLRVFKRLWKEEEGQALTEYGLIIALVALVVIGLLYALGGQIGTIFTEIKDGLANKNGTTSPSGG
ncbi:pilus assembly protein Flp/PilA [Salirhabdus euzebyi]|uniref:Pilus assembly protein Flp/PilA n=1 Tax=Salirhabdus euzebyi TaxID=394506 RepID=A0A841Q4G6_9BACI|nr:Flp family type IVb pilin [Salirhabdus euzebyi]MBB6453319.1 pilus assembly protein Flp/PilA [Salirhabdus euzebyi]